MACLSEPKDRAGQCKYHNPDHNAGTLDSLFGLQCYDLHGVADTEISVHGNASEEWDGTVQIEVEQEANKATHEVAKDPTVPHDVAGHEEGQWQAVHEVRWREVDHVDERGVPPLGLEKGSEEDDRVQGDAENEGERIADWEEDVLVGLIYAT